MCFNDKPILGKILASLWKINHVHSTAPGAQGWARVLTLGAGGARRARRPCRLGAHGRPSAGPCKEPNSKSELPGLRWAEEAGTRSVLGEGLRLGREC